MGFSNHAKSDMPIAWAKARATCLLSLDFSVSYARYAERKTHRLRRLLYGLWHADGYDPPASSEGREVLEGFRADRKKVCEVLQCMQKKNTC
jgi:hypothetical protein